MSAPEEITKIKVEIERLEQLCKDSSAIFYFAILLKSMID
jgi:hypothetical protein